MKSIRTFILIAIGMLAFTGTAKTTANLEQSQKVELVKDYSFTINEQKVVDVFQSINLSQVAVIVTTDSLNLKQISRILKFYQSTKEVGWCRLQNLTNNTIKNKDRFKDFKKVAANQVNRKKYLIQKYC